ncbi:hypothetical protein F183_A38630 [Bryobacterales bacterium F-183]|nr:hypothetical protein F183_A38630 [Bryobacterales bacterium F-183]
MKNVNVPLPEDLYAEIRAVATATNVPAADVVREAVDTWLHAQKRESRKKAIADYAREMAGTSFDLDRDLEAATAEHLRHSTVPAE